MLNEILRKTKSQFISAKKIFSIMTIIIGLTTFTNAQGITNTLGGNTSADKFIVENSDSEAGLVVTGEGNVGIGTTNPQSKLSVVGDGSSSYTIYGETSGSYGSGVYGRAVASTGRGVYGYAMGTSGRGVYGYASGSDGRGVYGSATNSGGVVINYGGFFTAAGSSGRGVYGLASGSYGRGVYGYADGVNGQGVRGWGGQWDFYAANSSSGNYGSASSIRWKTNIVVIDNPLEKLAELRGVYFDWDEEHGGQHDVGCIAEEVGKVLPEIVVYEENGIDADGMDYSKLTPLLVEAVNAQQKLIEELQAEIEILKRR